MSKFKYAVSCQGRVQSRHRTKKAAQAKARSMSTGLRYCSVVSAKRARSLCSRKLTRRGFGRCR